MPTLFLPPLLRESAGGRERLDVPAGTLRGALRSLEAEYPELVRRIVDGDLLAPGLIASIDGNFAPRSLSTVVGPEAEVHLLPAVGGGG